MAKPLQKTHQINIQKNVLESIFRDTSIRWCKQKCFKWISSSHTTLVMLQGLQLQIQTLPISTLIRPYVISVQQLFYLHRIKIIDEDNQLSWKESSSIISCAWFWNPT